MFRRIHQISRLWPRTQFYIRKSYPRLDRHTRWVLAKLREPALELDIGSISQAIFVVPVVYQNLWGEVGVLTPDG